MEVGIARVLIYLKNTFMIQMIVWTENVESDQMPGPMPLGQFCSNFWRLQVLKCGNMSQHVKQAWSKHACMQSVRVSCMLNFRVLQGGCGTWS